MIAGQAKLSKDINSLSDDHDLYDAGLTSLTTVNLMLALEDHFDIEFDDAMLTRATFQSINAISDVVEDMLR